MKQINYVYNATSEDSDAFKIDFFSSKFSMDTSFISTSRTSTFSS